MHQADSLDNCPLNVVAHVYVLQGLHETEVDVDRGLCRRELGTAMLVALVLYTINKSKKEYYLIEHVGGFVLVGDHVETVRVLEHVELVDDIVLLVAELAHIELGHTRRVRLGVLLQLKQLVELLVPQ